MMGTGGLELTHFINPDLTWKTVSKGYRSTPRRPRRSLTRNSKVGVDVADKSIRITEELAVSESEKLGVAVLGRRFGDKIDHVPIKKRRLMSRSPSPGTWQAPSHLVDNKHVSGHRSSRNYISKQGSMVTDTATATKLSNSGISKVLNEKIGYSEDFSGIEILAAAACNNSMDDDSNRYENPVGEISKKQDIGSLTSSMPLEEANTSMETNNYSHKNLAAEDKLECSPFQDNTTAIKQNLPSEKDDRTAERSVSLRDDRLHWDLNVVMDSWDQHCDAVIIGTETNVSVHNQKSKNLQISEACEMQREPKNMKHAGESIVQPTVDTVVSSDEHGKGMVLEASGLVGEEHEMEACSDLGGNNGTCFPPRTDNVLESSMCVVAGAKASTLDVGIDACLYPTPCPGSGAITSSGVCKETRNASPVSILVRQETEDCVSDMRLGETFCVHSVQVGKQDVAFPCAPASERDTCENEGTILNEDGEGTGRAFHLYGNDSPREMMCVENCQPLAPVSLEVEPEGNAGEMHVNWPSPRCEDMSASVVSYGDVQPMDLQPMVCTGAKGEPDEASVVHTAEVDPLIHVGSDQLVYKSSENSSCNWVAGESAPHEACQACADGPASIAGNIASDGTFEGSHSSDVSQDGRSHMVGMENTKFQAGYDSQFEDGELRESDVCCWGENGVEDDEAERVDYGSDNGETYDFDAADFSVSMPGKVEVRAECEEGRFCILEGENLEKKIKVQLPGGCEIFESKTLEVTHGSAMKKRNIESVDVDGLDVKDSPIKMVESRASRRELLSRFEKPLSFGTFHRKDPVLVQRSRSNNFDDSNKFLGRDRCAMRMRGRSPFHGRLVNPSAGFWDSKRGHSPTYTSVRTGPKYVIESRGNVMASGYRVSGATGGAGLDSRVHRQSTNSFSNGVYRPLIGRRSLADRDEAYGMDTGTRPVRDISPDRRRYRRHPRGFSGGFREEYHRTAPDESIEYTNGMPLRLARKEQSISPLSRERYCTPPYRKSQSRSRSRSPLAWLTPRGRYEGSRWRSRSPDFRPVPRIERLRLPYQKANFAAADEVGSRISPQRNSRWFDDNNSVGDHIRGRRSPVRMLRQRERFDSAYLSRKLNSDDYYGPMMRPGRSPGMGNTGRGCKYEGIDNDRRKNGSRYDMVHRMRRFDTDGVVRRFRYDAEDNFVAHNSNNYDDCDRGTDRRLGRVSEEKGRLRYNHKDI